MTKKYKIPLIMIIVTLSAFITTAVFAITNNSGKAADVQKNTGMTVISSKLSDESGNNDNKEMKEDSKETKKAYYKLLKDKRKKNTISYEKCQELDKAGYSIQDINSAEEYSSLCGYNAAEILEAKGVERNYEVKIEQDEKGNEVKTVIDKTNERWNEAVKNLGIDFITPALNLGISEEDVKEMQKSGMTDREIYEIANTSMEFDKDYSLVWDDYKKGLSVEELKGKYIKEIKGNISVVTRSETNDKTKREMLLKKAFKISDEQITMFKNNGISDYLDMANAIHYAAKFKTTLDQIIKLKKEKGTWEKVSDVIGGDKQ